MGHFLVKGFCQKPGFDFQDTFSHVVKYATVRIVLSLVLSHKWCLREVDINNAFFLGELSNEVYMIQPKEPSLVSSTLSVCKLQKALYGLKQAPRA